MRRIHILVAVEPTPLVRIIGHLFRSQPEFRILKRLRGCSTLVQEASRLRPKLIIANLKSLGNGAAVIISKLKLASRGSKLILINFPHDLARHASKWGADAYLDEYTLVSRLVPKVQRLLGRKLRQ